MTALDILDAIHASGASVKVSADQLLVVGCIPPQLLNDLSDRRLEVAAIIREHDQAPCASDIVRAAEAIAQHVRALHARAHSRKSRATALGVSST